MSAVGSGRTLYVGRPNLGDRDRFVEYLHRALDAGRLTNNGPLVGEFEERVRAVAGTREAVATANATTGMQMVARAAGLRPGDEIIVPAFTWVATPQAFEWIGLVPVFCDVLEHSGNIDPDSARAAIGPKTRAIVGVHAFGRAVEVEALHQLADDYGLALLYDAAHAFASQVAGCPVGSSGLAEVFSFHATKFVHSFEGGAVVTNDPERAAVLRQERDMGMDPSRSVRGPGTVSRMSEAHAAMGLVSLEALDAFVAHNHQVHARYEQRLDPVEGVSFLSMRGGVGDRTNAQYVVTRLHRQGARNAVFEHLLSDQILARKYFHPGCHRLEPYARAMDRHIRTALPVTEELSDQSLALPTGMDISMDDVDRVCARIQECLAAGGFIDPGGAR